MSHQLPVHRIAAIPGDGIGTEVTEAALEALEAAAAASGAYKVEVTTLPWGTTFWKETGSYLPEDFETTLHGFDAVLFGAVGMPGKLEPFPKRGLSNLIILLCRRAGSRIALGTSAQAARIVAAVCERSADSLCHKTPCDCMRRK